MRSDVIWLLTSHLLKEVLEYDKLSVFWATNPSRALDAVLWLLAEIFSSIVDY